MRILLTLLICFYTTISHASQNHYHLDISFQPDQGRLQGKATIEFPAGEQWQLFTTGLDIQQISIQEEGKPPFELPIPAGDSISMYAGRLKQQVTVIYSLQTDSRDYNNRIHPDGIALTSEWHPVPAQDIYG